MSFLSPLALALVAAALVPLLIHLRRRRVTRTVEFPAARYLARATREHERSLRVRSSLLLLVQLAIVGLVALAAARPLARIGRGHAPTAMAIVIDNSMSSGAVVGGGRVLSELARMARAIIAAAAPGDRIWLVTANGSITAGDARALLPVLDTLRPLAGAGSTAAAVRAAAALSAREPNAVPSLVVLTDGQASQWRESLRVPDMSVTVAIPTSGLTASRGIIGAEPRPRRWSNRGIVRIRTVSAESLAVRVVLGERTIARSIAPPNATIDVAAPAAGAGWIAGRVEIDRDELAADDVRWFAVWQGFPPRVAADAGPFVADAVDALVSAGAVVRGSEAAIVQADRLASLPALIVAPGNPSAIGAANRALARVGIPWRFGAERRGDASASGAGLSRVRVKVRYALVPTAGAPVETLLVAGGEPWAVAGDRWVLLGSPLDTSATLLPVTAEFVPWLARVVAERLATGGGTIMNAAPGSSIDSPRDADGLEATDGSRTAVRGATTVPSRAGVYFWTSEARRIGALVVNPEAAESDVRGESEAELAARFAPARVRIVRTPAQAASSAFGAAGRRPVAGPLLAGVLALLVVESVAAGALARRPLAVRQAA